MEVPIQVAVRIKPPTNLNDIICVNSIPYNNNNTIQLGNQQTFPVSYALPQDCSQTYIFATTIHPLINCLIDGCDVSVVTLGQAESGKTYTLLGPGLHCAFSESEHGIIPRFIREVFIRLSTLQDRNITISITWTQICGENIQDLLGHGSVQVNSVSEAFHWLQLGLTNISPSSHTLFTLTLEQQNISEHKISTASFTDLTSCEKVAVLDNYGEVRSIPLDSGLLSLHNVIATLTETTNQYIPYNQSTLTTLLKDSFGGRARTLIISCVSPLLRDFNETLYTLQLSEKMLHIRNFVTTNSYLKDQEEDLFLNNQNNNYPPDMFGLHFAITQWTKLVTNAENLFNKIITTKELSDQEMDQISEWLMLKAECEECLSSDETISITNYDAPRSLGRIEEENETDESSAEEDLDQQFILKLDGFMAAFRRHTDLISLEAVRIVLPDEKSDKKLVKKGAARRRCSTNLETPDYFTNYGMNKQKRIKQIVVDLESGQKQIDELEYTIQIKQSLIQNLIENGDTRTYAKQKFHKKRTKLQQEYLKARSQLSEAESRIQQCHNIDKLGLKDHVEKCASVVRFYEKRLKDLETIRCITEDSTRKVHDLQNSLQTSKKQLDRLKKTLKKEEKHKLCLEQELIQDDKIEDKIPEEIVKIPEVKYEECEDKDSLRHEIRNLRRTRDCLIEQRCVIDQKYKKDKMLSENEERKLLEFEEAISAIDCAIEYKNELICGNKNPDLPDKNKKGEEILMQRLLKLSPDEMRTLLYKYFNRVIDLRESSKKLELQNIQLERDRDSNVWRIQTLSHLLQQVRLESERRVVLLQQQHEEKLNLLMRHFCDETSASSDPSDFPDNPHKVDKIVSKMLNSDHNQICQIAGTSRQMEITKYTDKNKLIAKFQELKRYSEKQRIPSQNLRQLQGNSDGASTKVTRQKNKLIIQQSKTSRK